MDNVPVRTFTIRWIGPGPLSRAVSNMLTLSEPVWDALFRSCRDGRDGLQYRRELRPDEAHQLRDETPLARTAIAVRGRLPESLQPPFQRLVPGQPQFPFR